MKESEEIVIVIDGEKPTPDFGNPEWVAGILKKSEAKKSEFSARARKKKRIYKRKKSDLKPSA
jgi:hypothetical protein